MPEESYNQSAYRRALAKGICGICRRNILIEGLTYCKVCRDKMIQRRIEARKNKLCTTCNINPVALYSRKCEACKLKNRQAVKTSRAEADAQGLCKTCKKNQKADWSKWFCEVCIAKHNKANQIQAQKLREAKICKSCRKRPVIGGKKPGRGAGWGGSNNYCKDCMAKHRARRRAKDSKKSSAEAWSKFRKKKGANGRPINISARIGADKEFEESFGIFNKGKVI